MTMNGVDMEKVGDLVAAIGERPELAHVSFSVTSTWTGGFAGSSSTGAVRQAGADHPQRTTSFAFDSDEPHVLLGRDAAASAGEYVLQALAACYSVTFAANASSQGIELDSLAFDIEGDFDLHGFLGLADHVRPGLQEVRVAVRAESSNATRAQLQDLVETVERRSPIRDSLTSGVPVVTTLAA